MKNPFKVSIIIPAYNEAKTLAQVIEKTRCAALPSSVGREILVVDDGSTDGTPDILRQFGSVPNVRVLTLAHNQGKTAAILAGVEAARGEYVIVQDADLEYDPCYYEALLGPIISGKASVTLGSRFLGTIKHMRLLIRLANRFNNWFVNRLYGCSLTDVNSGLKVFPKDLLKGLRITSGRFGGEAEITCRLLRMGHTIAEVPIRYVARSKAEGKKMDFFHALHIFWCFIVHRFSYARG